jgi:hypothetical protein
MVMTEQKLSTIIVKTRASRNIYLVSGETEVKDRTITCVSEYHVINPVEITMDEIKDLLSYKVSENNIAEGTSMILSEYQDLEVILTRA